MHDVVYLEGDEVLISEIFEILSKNLKFLMQYLVNLDFTRDIESDNLQYNILGCWVDGMSVSLTKCLMFQVLLFFS